MSALSRLACSCVVFFALAATALAANTYTTIDFPGADETQVNGINNQGVMVGWYACECGHGLAPHGFMLSGGVFTTVEPPGAIGSVAYGINDAKQVVGGYNDEQYNPHGFIFDGVNFVTIDFPGARETTLSGINNNGDIVGYYTPSQGDHIYPAGFLLSNGTYTTIQPPQSFYTRLTGINNLGGIVGWAEARYQDFGFRYGHGVIKPFQFPGTYGTFGTSTGGINDNGVIVGTADTQKGNGCFALLKNGEFKRITFPDSFHAPACLGSNNSGQIVGFYAGGDHGFLMTPGQ